MHSANDTADPAAHPGRTGVTDGGAKGHRETNVSEGAVACSLARPLRLLAGVAMLNNRVAGTFSRNEDVYQDPATGN